MDIFCHLIEENVTFGRFDYWNDSVIVKWLNGNFVDSEEGYTSPVYLL